MGAHRRKRGDTREPFRSLLAAGGVPVALTADDTVRFLMVQRVGSKAVQAVAGVLAPDSDPSDPYHGWVTYQPTAGDVDTAGIFRQEWEVTFVDGTKATFPSPEYNEVVIYEDLG